MSSIDSLLNSVAANKNFTADEQKMLAQVPAEQRDLMTNQLRLDKEQQAVSTISNILKKLNEMSMAIINNMR
ncbi:hypothetical protein [Hyalangium versicolor]|uniref:hypothetical protein n=1 Tax=Hyalangium versicolor TaxID=2861190 RepID=UPI001CC94B79|nr:hypothetical protein [Hyalangium versicolor]